MSDERAEVEALRALLEELRPGSVARPPCPRPVAPFEALPSLGPETLLALEAAALEANDSYLMTFLEPSSFCPFSRGGRSRGQTTRFVHYADTTDPAPLLARMAEAARDPSKAVVQVILPLVETEPAAWSHFCHALTAAGNEELRENFGGGEDIFAVAPLHPELPYSSANPFALIPLLRRTPDPTIQWVRLDALEALYSGRSGDTVFADPDDLESFLARPRRSALFERIAESNLKMATRLGIPQVEQSLRDLARAARERYARVLLDEGSSSAGPEREASLTVIATDTSPPRAALRCRDDRWALVRKSDLMPRVPIRVLADGVEVAVIRSGEDVHVLHGRCPHRHAPLTDAIVGQDQLVCPHHGWDFRLASGRSDGVPGASVARFEATVEEDLVWIDGEALRRWREASLDGFRDDDDVI